MSENIKLNINKAIAKFFDNTITIGNITLNPRINGVIDKALINRYAPNGNPLFLTNDET